MICLQVEGRYYTHGSLNMEGGKPNWENFQAVYGLGGLGGGDGRGQILGDTEALVLYTYLYSRESEVVYNNSGPEKI